MRVGDVQRLMGVQGHLHPAEAGTQALDQGRDALQSGHRTGHRQGRTRQVAEIVLRIDQQQLQLGMGHGDLLGRLAVDGAGATGREASPGSVETR